MARIFGPRSRLTRRQQQVLRKFRIGYTAWSVMGVGTANLIPNENVIGHQERVLVSTLDELVAAGLLVTYGEFLHDVYWTLPSKGGE